MGRPNLKSSVVTTPSSRLGKQPVWPHLVWVTLVYEGGQAQPRAGGKDLSHISIQSHGNTFSREFLQKARSLLSLDQKGLVYISQPKVFAHKTSYKHSEIFLDHRNIVKEIVQLNRSIST